MVGQQAMTEAVEVADREACLDRRAERRLQPLTELPGRLDVVGQDQDLLGEERVLRAGRVRGRAWPALGLEQPAHTLDDDPRLAGPRARDDDRRPILELDDAPLLRGQRRTNATCAVAAYRSLAVCH